MAKNNRSASLELVPLEVPGPVAASTEVQVVLEEGRQRHVAPREPIAVRLARSRSRRKARRRILTVAALLLLSLFIYLLR